jgi:hypothetical protein
MGEAPSPPSLQEHMACDTLASHFQATEAAALPKAAEQVLRAEAGD